MGEHPAAVGKELPTMNDNSTIPVEISDGKSIIRLTVESLHWIDRNRLPHDIGIPEGHALAIRVTDEQLMYVLRWRGG